MSAKGREKEVFKIFLDDQAKTLHQHGIQPRNQDMSRLLHSATHVMARDRTQRGHRTSKYNRIRALVIGSDMGYDDIGQGNPNSRKTSYNVQVRADTATLYVNTPTRKDVIKRNVLEHLEETAPLFTTPYSSGDWKQSEGQEWHIPPRTLGDRTVNTGSFEVTLEDPEVEIGNFSNAQGLRILEGIRRDIRQNREEPFHSATLRLKRSGKFDVLLDRHPTGEELVIAQAFPLNKQTLKIQYAAPTERFYFPFERLDHVMRSVFNIE